MRLLLDTHIVLWWLAGSRSLPAAARKAIADPATEAFVSAATVWEIVIKQAAGRLDAPDDLLDALAANDFETVPIRAEHALAAGRLPAHHTDPFDRVIVAQARIEGLTLATVDRRLHDDDVAVLSLP